jgi:hypothetical protein
MSAYDDLLERVVALEQRDLTLSDLPIADIQRKLENDWQPEGSTLLSANSITVDQLASGSSSRSASARWCSLRAPTAPC